MNIVIEGPDNSGKSTLARLISEALHRPVFSSEGPEKRPGELLERVDRYRGLTEVVFDRHPCISDIIYSAFRGRPSPMQGSQESLFYAREPLMIYCDPLQRGLLGHVEKAHDSSEHVQMIHQRYHAILTLYREWAIHRAHIVYRIGDDPERIIRFCRDFDPVKDVTDFHLRFNRSYDGKPRVLPDEMQNFGEKFLRQELQEYINNAQDARAYLDDCSDTHITPEPEAIASYLADMLDGLVDLVYVAIGRAQWHGFDFRAAWTRVHRANMTKRLATKRSESERGSLLDIVKPENFQKPDHSDLVKDHIHR